MTALDPQPALPATGESPTPGADTPRQERIASSMADQIPRGPRAMVRQFFDDYNLLRATKYGIGPLAVIFLLDLVQGFDSSIPTLLLPEIRAEFNATLLQMTLLGQAFGMIGLVTGPLIGWLADRTRRTYLVAASAIASGALSIGSSFAGNMVAFQGMRSLDSTFGESLGNVPTSSLLFDYYPIEARAKTISIRRVAATVLGLFTGPAVGLLTVWLGWRRALVSVSPLVIATGLLALWKLPEPPRGYWERLRAGEQEGTAVTEQPPAKVGETIRTLLANKTLRRLMFIAPITGVARGGYGALFGFYVVEQFRLNAFERALIGIPGQIVAVVSLLLGGVIADAIIKKNPGRVLVLDAVLAMAAAASQIFVVFVPSLIALIGFRLVISFFDNLLEPATYGAMSTVIPPRMRGSAIGALTLLFLPTIPFAALPAYVADRYGIRTGLMLYAPFYILASILKISAARFFKLDQRAAIASANATNEYNRAKAAGTVKLLLCRDVDVEYNGVQVLFNLDLDVDEGELIALLGTNGAGKSTLLRAISGIQEASNGAVYYDGRDITHVPPHEIARLGIVHMPGGKCTFPTLTVQENLDLALLEAPDEGAERRMQEVMELFPELEEKRSLQAGLLSGGEQQMVGLAQAFLWKPRLLMIDELSLGLAPAVVTRLLDIVRRINGEGATVVLVEQSVNVSLSIAERAIFMEKGEIKFDGPTSALFQRPDILRSVYLKGASSLAGARSSGEALVIDRSRPLLEVEGLTKSFGGTHAVTDVSFVVHEGETLGLIGPNGAGKTTVFDLISGYVPPDRGIVKFDGIDITRMSADERARLRIVRRFQDAKLFQSLTVFEAICLALDRHLEIRNVFLTAVQVGAVRRGEARIRARADRLVELLELGAYRDKFISDLSTGVRRVTDLACVLAAEPRLVLLDEPSSGIAQAESEALVPLLRRIRHETGCSMLLIEHDMNLITRVSDELLALVGGRVIVQGSPEIVLEHEQVVSAYLGDDDVAVNRSGVRK